MIDSHVHFWDPARGYPWLAGAGEPFERAYGWGDYRDSGGADHIVLVEGNDASGAEDARHLALREEGILGVVTRALAPGAVGVRGPRVDAVTPDILQQARRAAEAGVAFELLSSAHALADAPSIARAASPGRVVIDHLGSPARHNFGEWTEAMNRLADEPNVFVKVSGVLALDEHVLGAAAEVALGRFGPHRVLIGSDWPICLRHGSLRESLDRAIAAVAGDTDSSDRAAHSAYAV